MNFNGVGKNFLTTSGNTDMMIPVEGAANILGVYYVAYLVTIVAFLAMISMIPTDLDDWRD